ncbi:flagellar basal body P-ring formation chaperone FlgA [Salinispirillum marinum]|uniref:Flagella basal body P-ring formation protein FlgA n=2 Tax=Saccharospirillaceae TaxID=255527 RepID=A0ABV8BHS6_9GAMM
MAQFVTALITFFRVFVAGLSLLLSATHSIALDEDRLQHTLQQYITTSILDHYAQATAENISITINMPNAVRSLDECTAPLEISASRNQWVGNVRLVVSCAGESTWTTYITASVGMHLPVVTLSRSLPRNSVITADDISMQVKNIADEHQGFYLDADAVIGSALARDLGLGYVLHSRVLNAPTLVSRGDAVTIRATGGGISVSMAGTAMMDGTEGRQISVRNNSSGKVLRAWVVDRGLVEVPFTATR